MAVGARGDGAGEVELLPERPKLALTPDKENMEWEEEGGDEPSVSIAWVGRTVAEEAGSGRGKISGAGCGGKNVHRMACEMLTVGSRSGLKSWGFRCCRSARLVDLPTMSFWHMTIPSLSSVARAARDHPLKQKLQKNGHKVVHQRTPQWCQSSS